MQIQKQEPEAQTDVQLNMDLTREILYAIERNPEMDGSRDFIIRSPEDLGIHDYSRAEVLYHLRLLGDAGFIDTGGSGPSLSGDRHLRRLTWDGHEFLSNIKTDTLWEKVKEQASGLTGVGIKVLASLAESEVKRYLGII